MSFLEARMADQLSYGFEVVVSYNTLVVPMDSGKEARNANWTRAKRRFTAEHTALSESQFDLLVAIFHAVRGSAYGFRFKDWTDFRATLESLGTTPGTTSTPVQLIKTYTNGSLSTVRTIVKPVAGSVTVYQDDIAKPGTLDTVTGLFTPTTAWTASKPLTWTGEFDVPVRFAADELPATYTQYRVIQSAIDLVEDPL